MWVKVHDTQGNSHNSTFSSVWLLILIGRWNKVKKCQLQCHWRNEANRIDKIDGLVHISSVPSSAAIFGYLPVCPSNVTKCHNRRHYYPPIGMYPTTSDEYMWYGIVSTSDKWWLDHIPFISHDDHMMSVHNSTVYVDKHDQPTNNSRMLYWYWAESIINAKQWP